MSVTLTGTPKKIIHESGHLLVVGLNQAKPDLTPGELDLLRAAFYQGAQTACVAIAVSKVSHEYCHWLARECQDTMSANGFPPMLQDWRDRPKTELEKIQEQGGG